ncbi:MAG: GYD domain-containing protein [Actinomycetota bacterium]
MRTYILLSTLAPQGAQTLKATPERLLEVNREIEALGARVVKQWAVLGPYDFVSVVEAPDERVISRVSMALGSRGSARLETLLAIPVQEFLALRSEDAPGE